MTLLCFAVFCPILIWAGFSKTRLGLKTVYEAIKEATLPASAIFERMMPDSRPWYGLCAKHAATTVSAFHEQVEKDPVLKAHYKNFDWNRAHVFTAETDMDMHVAYRTPSTIAWTKRKIRITQGEKLITDDKTIIRTYCCNQIADSPLGPVLPEEPPEELLQPAIKEKARPGSMHPSLAKGRAGSAGDIYALRVRAAPSYQPTPNQPSPPVVASKPSSPISQSSSPAVSSEAFLPIFSPQRSPPPIASAAEAPPSQFIADPLSVYISHFRMYSSYADTGLPSVVALKHPSRTFSSIPPVVLLEASPSTFPLLRSPLPVVSVKETPPLGLIPEPSSLLLIAVGIIGMGFYSWLRRRRMK
ncbi:PEP-CTERM sorting domain-containing protein [Candidatus Poribacteria bacterium]|nr:PEP-CTERM sorting domain-containing protein [Candidatus Poribacteria bacterium]